MSNNKIIYILIGRNLYNLKPVYHSIHPYQVSKLWSAVQKNIVFKLTKKTMVLSVTYLIYFIGTYLHFVHVLLKKITFYFILL